MVCPARVVRSAGRAPCMAVDAREGGRKGDVSSDAERSGLWISNARCGEDVN